MAKYMPQEIFDACVLTIIKLHLKRGDNMLENAYYLARQYRKYLDAHEIGMELYHTARLTLEGARTNWPNENHPELFEQMQEICLEYTPYGEKRPKRFAGTWFAPSGPPLSTKKTQFGRNHVKYYNLVKSWRSSGKSK